MSNILVFIPILTLQFISVLCQRRIIGGEDINISLVPYMLSFMLNGRHVCGAAVISRKWGITAAHCATAYRRDPYREVTIRSGSSLVDEGGVMHKITKIIWHEKYKTTDNHDDVAVFKVKPIFKFNAVTQPVNLPIKGVPFKNDWGVVTGWGYFMADNPVVARQLQYLRVPKVSMEDCLEDYKGLFKVHLGDVCYGFRQGGKDSCRGDSGGPLVNDDKILIGITSWGRGCAERFSPGLYIDTLFYRSWIKLHTGV